ncbi:MAG: hypothetical protein HOI95_09110 [Chromatiales bacterium]|nr:hypothetical protein [Chromatiales bacterium]
MSGLAHFIERSGVATTSISLIREHTEAVSVPRALWVPFPLGRPLGVAGDAAFQTRVLRATLALLETATGPGITDYDEEAPASPPPESWVCPVSFPPADGESLEARFLSEIALLRPWADETRRARGRTMMGASGIVPDDIETMAKLLAHVADGGDLHQLPSWATHIEWWHPMPLLLRHIVDDVRILYQEAVAAQPGSDAPDHQALTRWIFKDMVFGDVLTGIADTITAAGDRRLLTLRGYLIPEGYVPGDESFGRRQLSDPPGFQRALVGNKLLRGELEG